MPSARTSRRRSTNLLPTGIFTIPEVSTVGETEESLKSKGTRICGGHGDAIARTPEVKSSVTPTGFLKLLFNRSDMRLLGVHVIGEQASELVHIGLMAMQSGGGAELFSRVCFNYPTLGELYKFAAYDAMLKQMGLIV